MSVPSETIRLNKNNPDSETKNETVKQSIEAGKTQYYYPDSETKNETVKRSIEAGKTYYYGGGTIEHHVYMDYSNHKIAVFFPVDYSAASFQVFQADKENPTPPTVFKMLGIAFAEYWSLEYAADDFVNFKNFAIHAAVHIDYKKREANDFNALCAEFIESDFNQNIITQKICEKKKST